MKRQVYPLSCGFICIRGSLLRNNRLFLSLLLILLVYSLVFMSLMRYEGQHQNVNLASAIYWVVVTMNTLGLGDIVFKT